MYAEQKMNQEELRRVRAMDRLRIFEKLTLDALEKEGLYGLCLLLIMHKYRSMSIEELEQRVVDKAVSHADTVGHRSDADYRDHAIS